MLALLWACGEFAEGEGPGGEGTDTAIGSSSTTATPSSSSSSASSTGASAEGSGEGTESSSGGTTGTAPASSSSTTAAAPSGPYPIILAHGFFGFEDFAGAGFVDYFWDVPATLADGGETQVFTPEVDPFNDSTVRGQQLLEAVERVLEQTGAEKVNIIGHSQGGLDARVVAHLRPEWVASVTTVSTPHGGSPIADYVLLVPGGSGAVIDTLLQVLGGPLWGAIGNTTSLLASMEQFSEAGIADFDAAYPDAPGVAYYSVAGRSDGHTGQSVCATEDAPPFINNWNGIVDPIDPLFAVAEAIVDGGLASSIANDGLVRVEDAKWGTFLGCIPADHVDEIGHLFGDSAGGDNPFDHRVFYRNLVGYLRARGF